MVHNDCITMQTPSSKKQQNLNETSQSDTKIYVGIRKTQSVTICCTGTLFCVPRKGDKH